jgi:hypothetical protein
MNSDKHPDPDGDRYTNERKELAMRKNILTSTMVCVAVMTGSFVFAADEAVAPKEKIQLFDGTGFDGWVRYLKDGQGDVDQVWSVKPGGLLACTGNPKGYMRTEKAYKDYHFRMEYRWTGKTGNNGVLVHMTGEDTVWPKSLECQGMFHNQGDFFEIGGFEFNEHKSGGHRVKGRRVLKYGEHNEKEAAEWNVYEVWAVGDTVRPYVNGKLMNEASGCVIAAGKICLQSEGAPIEFRNITLAPATKKPWPVTPMKKIQLFNGKDLDGWVPFLPEDKPDEDKMYAAQKLWSASDGVMRCEGKLAGHDEKLIGYIRTVEHYADYRLHVEWRWPGEPSNSGVLLHRTGIDQGFPVCIESQLKSGSAGDLVMMNEATLVVDGVQQGPKKFAVAKKKHESNEKAPGEWNAYDIVCKGDTVQVSVNGQLQNEGVKASVSSGPISLQSEGGSIEFRNVYLEPLGK